VATRLSFLFEMGMEKIASDVFLDGLSFSVWDLISQFHILWEICGCSWQEIIPAQKFRDALEDLPVAVAGSLMLRNNYRYFELSLNRLYSDLLEKYPVERTKVIVAGFSGGARMALEYSLKYPVRGIVMFGAGPVQLRGGPQGKWIYAVSGTEDFNFGGQFRLRERLFQGRSRMAT
jgi:pimeloyl-ACP methyl ester carboxylesterase